ncbi:YigZ family protein [Bifidobacterium mongoliense]|uniref:IMPACT family protein n=1 Tax=Bifidobacterium mongoliense TaxID=518643 RepID=UPI0030EDEE5A
MPQSVMTILDPPERPAQGRVVDRKSEFLGEACHVGSVREALAVIEGVRGRNPKARHVAYAAIVDGHDVFVQDATTGSGADATTGSGLGHGTGTGEPHTDSRYGAGGRQGTDSRQRTSTESHPDTDTGTDMRRIEERMSDDGEPSGTAGKPILEVLRTRGLTDCVVSVTRYFGGILLGSGGLIRAYAGSCTAALDTARLARLVKFQRYYIDMAYSPLAHFQDILASLGGEQLDVTYTDRVSLRVAVPAAHREDFERRVREAFSATIETRRIGTERRAVAIRR